MYRDDSKQCFEFWVIPVLFIYLVNPCSVLFRRSLLRLFYQSFLTENFVTWFFIKSTIWKSSLLLWEKKLVSFRLAFFTLWIFAQKWARQNMSLEKIYFALWMYTKAREKEFLKSYIGLSSCHLTCTGRPAHSSGISGAV